MKSGACFSKDGLRRITLWRTWSNGPRVMWIGLNPSTAGAEQEDQTTRKIRGFSERWGYGGYLLVNLFDLCATDPHDLRGKPLEELTSKANRTAILAGAAGSDLIVCAWGRHGRLHGRALAVYEMLREKGYALSLRAVAINEDGSPAHPLMLSYEMKHVPFKEKNLYGL